VLEIVAKGLEEIEEKAKEEKPLLRLK